MIKLRIFLAAIVVFSSTTANPWGGNWQKNGSPYQNYGRPQHHYGPPHHWHDCGSSEMDWNKHPGGSNWNWKDPDYDSNNSGWVYSGQKRPRPPWPAPRPTSSKPTPIPTFSPTPSPTPIPTPNPTPTGKTPQDIQECMRNCPVTSQYNPVCGTNGVTYANLGRLECAKFCGIDVQVLKPSRCPDSGGISPTPPTSPSTPTVQDCISRCPVTSEYNPVCGSNGVTYGNLGRLECAKACGISVELSRNSRCPENQVSTGAPPLTVTNPAPSSSTNSGLDFTIDKDILDDIFNNPEETGAGILDERHQDDD